MNPVGLDRAITPGRHGTVASIPFSAQRRDAVEIEWVLPRHQSVLLARLSQQTNGSKAGQINSRRLAGTTQLTELESYSQPGINLGLTVQSAACAGASAASERRSADERQSAWW